MSARPVALLVQLPIPPAGPQPIRGNVPLAAGYLSLYAQRKGLTERWQIDILPTTLANTLSDRGLVAEILARRPRLLGFTCYLWNIERSLWIAAEIKARDPSIQVIVGGPEIASDNAWVLAHPAVDFAAIGEGEQTFCELLTELSSAPKPRRPIDGLWVRGFSLTPPAFRKPLPHLDEVSSPYLEGILNVADERMMLLETIRGCIFKCKFCFYPKAYDDLYFLSQDRLTASLELARRDGAEEIVMLDPTLNQRKNFGEFLDLLAQANPERQFKYFGELRGEGINEDVAKRLAAANFTEVEIGLQSTNRKAQELMDRRNNMKAFERGAKAMLAEGIEVKVDLIVGLPGDDEESVRAGMDYLLDCGLYSSVQVFQLSILPGTAFRQEAVELGLTHQDRPPYYVMKTPTLDMARMYDLMCEAQEKFGIEYDPIPAPELDWTNPGKLAGGVRIDLDAFDVGSLELSLLVGLSPGNSCGAFPLADRRSQAFTLWLAAHDLAARQDKAVALVDRLLTDNPFTTLQIVLEPLGDPRSASFELLDELTRACWRRPTYLDRFYAVMPNPGRPRGAKRIVIALPSSTRDELGPDWTSSLGDYASIVWTGPAMCAEDELEEHEHQLATPRTAEV